MLLGVYGPFSLFATNDCVFEMTRSRNSGNPTTMGEGSATTRRMDRSQRREPHAHALCKGWRGDRYCWHEGTAVSAHAATTGTRHRLRTGILPADLVEAPAQSRELGAGLPLLAYHSRPSSYCHFHKHAHRAACRFAIFLHHRLSAIFD